MMALTHPWSMRAEGEVVSFPTERVEARAQFDTFVEDEHERLYKALYFVTGSREDAEDLAQDAFLKLWERWDEIDRISDPTGYLFRVALNGFRMRRRRAAIALRRLAPVPAERDEFAEAEMRRRSPSPARAFAATAGGPPARGPARLPVRASGAHPARPAVDGPQPCEPGP
jgi:hypothetical protein